MLLSCLVCLSLWGETFSNGFCFQEKLEKYNIQVTTSVKKPDPPKQPPTKGAKKRFDDDDDIEIVSEKITQKTKMKIAQKKKMAKMKPKAVIKVNSAQGKQMLKTIAKTGKVPKSLSSSSTSSSTTSIFSSSSGFGDDDEEEEDNLNCPTCFSAFWYPSQVGIRRVLTFILSSQHFRRLSTWRVSTISRTPRNTWRKRSASESENGERKFVLIFARIIIIQLWWTNKNVVMMCQSLFWLYSFE